ncbi:hypothetical protein OG612_43475 (plasmid) [Streptomyces sp. NBC_01527]|uniref:hypothetical protein n=1 Tax=unclassified Streptomyces TaxID=2593676 RepID=UPI002E162BB3|nr:hypothetical protein OG763_44745 [Streptomyces sp. NBC_01230]
MATIPKEGDGSSSSHGVTPETGKPPVVTDGNHYPHNLDLPPGSVSTDHAFKPPPVPGGKGGKGTSVDTASMKVMAQNIREIIPYVEKMDQLLADLDVAGGTFYDANMLRVWHQGGNKDAGLRKDYRDVLSFMKHGFVDLTTALDKMSKKYAVIEDANGMSAKDLAEFLGNTPTDFNNMISANGGNPATPSGATPPDTGGGKTPSPSPPDTGGGKKP